MKVVASFLVGSICLFIRCSSFSPQKSLNYDFRQTWKVVPRTSLLPLSTTADKPSTFTYVEEGFFDDRAAEIEALGGDPFFLPDEDVNEAIAQVETIKDSNSEVSHITTLLGSMISADPCPVTRYATDGQGPSPKATDQVKPNNDVWEWDGSVDDDAHLDLD